MMGFEIEGFGERLSAALEAIDMSQGELSRRTGLRPETISRWSRGQTPRLPELLVVAAALDISLDWLVYGDRASSVDLAESIKWAIDEVQLDARGAHVLRESCARIGKLERQDVYTIARRIAANAAERAKPLPSAG